MKTVLVTGAGGFLGTHLVRQLLEQSDASRIRTFTRSPFTALADQRIEPVQGDITSVDDVNRAVAGAEEIYHLAGVVERDPARPWVAYQTHVEGTRHVCEAMRKHGTGRCVVASSSGTIAVSKEPTVHAEDSAYAYDVVADWPYYLSKIYQEKLAFWYMQHRKLPIVVINPSLLLGPGDARRSSTGDVRLFLKGQIKLLPSGGLNLVDARDAAAGAIGAMRRGRVGERYLLTGDNLTFHEWIRRTARISGVPAPKFMLPVELARAGAAVLRQVYPIAGGKFQLDDESVKMSALFWYADSSKARRELQFTTRPTDETLRDTIDDIRREEQAA